MARGDKASGADDGGGKGGGEGLGDLVDHGVISRFGSEWNLLVCSSQ
ncbi:MAG: hypothetical protein MO846_02395 [Candidatus Devosia symbiotica]|nr:hypothetical protein [Candidatus Devosia symbiotica]